MNKDKLYDAIDKDDDLTDKEKRDIFFSEVEQMEEEEEAEFNDYWNH